MAHTPQCLIVYGSIETIVLPDPSQVVQVPSGTAVGTGVLIPKGKAIVICAPTADVVLTIPLVGGTNPTAYVLPIAGGKLTRIILPPNLETLPVAGTCTDNWSCWVETLRTLEDREPY